MHVSSFDFKHDKIEIRENANYAVLLWNKNANGEKHYDFTTTPFLDKNWLNPLPRVAGLYMSSCDAPPHSLISREDYYEIDKYWEPTPGPYPPGTYGSHNPPLKRM